MQESHEPVRGIALQDIVYNLSDSTRRLAYKAGFSLGETTNRHFPGLASLEKILSSAGFGKILYYPSETRALITSRKSSGIADLGLGKMHAFEAGIIAGHLSSLMKREIGVREAHCSLGGAQFCQFIASPHENAYEGTGTEEGLEAAAAILRRAVSAGGPGMTEPYRMLSMLPIMRRPLSAEVEKLFYALGKKLAVSDDNAREEGIRRLAAYSGAKKADVEANARTAKVVLRFDLYNSVGSFLDLTSALLSGYLGGAYPRCSITQSRRFGNGKTYILEMKAIRGVQ